MAVSRNDLCPCGSGKKYKKCCLGAPDPQTVRHAKTLKILFAVLVVVTVATFMVAGQGVGSAVGLASFGVCIGYLLLAPENDSNSPRPGQKSGGGPPI